MNHSVLVSFIPDGNFIALTTLSRQYHRSPRFLLSIDIANAFMDGTSLVLYDNDLNNFISAYYVDADTLLFRITWLQNIGGDQLRGRIESFELPADLLADAINGNPEKRIVCKDVSQCPIVIKPSAQRMISRLNQLERRALSKALRDNWHWSHSERIKLYADWNSSFYFDSETISGGLCQHTDTIKGKDEKPHHRIRYSVHT